MEIVSPSKAAMAKVYEKPCIKRVILVPEEACLVGCKTTSAGGPGSTYTCFYQPIACIAPGS